MKKYALTPRAFRELEEFSNTILYLDENFPNMFDLCITSVKARQIHNREYRQKAMLFKVFMEKYFQEEGDFQKVQTRAFRESEISLEAMLKTEYHIDSYDELWEDDTDFELLLNMEYICEYKQLVFTAEEEDYLRKLLRGVMSPVAEAIIIKLNA